MEQRHRKVHSAIYSSTESKQFSVCMPKRTSLCSIPINADNSERRNMDLPIVPSVIEKEKESTRKEQEIKKRRRKNVKKLEEMEEKVGRRERQLKTTPGSRIFTLPGRLKPVSLFVRIGSLQDDNDVIPIEFYDISRPESSETERTEDITPHPAAVVTKNIFHVGDEEYFNRLRNIHISAKTNDAKKKRPYSVQFPLQSALKKPTDKTRPKSLRILDPRDMKIYEPSKRNSCQLGVNSPFNEDLNTRIERLKLNASEKYPHEYLRQLGTNNGIM